jgi:hypothetical protein
MEYRLGKLPIEQAEWACGPSYIFAEVEGATPPLAAMLPLMFVIEIAATAFGRRRHALMPDRREHVQTVNGLMPPGRTATDKENLPPRPREAGTSN